MCAQITDFSKKGGNGLGIVEYSNIEAGVQTSYAAVEVEITDSVPDSDGNKPTQKPALAAVIDSGNIVRSFVECSGGGFKVLCEPVSYVLLTMILGVANCRTKQSCCSDYFE